MQALTEKAGSDETSPTGPSGSAQLNPSSEAVPWSSQGAIWNPSTHSSHKPSASGSASPTRIRDMHEMANTSQFFSRASLGQNGSTFPSRPKPTGNMDAAGSSSKYPTFGDAVADTTEGSGGLYGAISASSGIYRRNSSDSAFASFNPNRQGNRQGNTNTRHPEAESNVSPSHFVDYSFSQIQNQRPTVPNHSVSYPIEGPNRSRVPGFGADVTDKNLSNAFKQVLSLEDGSEPTMNGYATNGFPNPATQSFQFNPSSSSWQHEPASSSRGYGLQDSLPDPMSGAYYHPKRGSGGGGSPIGGAFRTSLNSPRTFGSTPNPRAEPWNKPSVRDPRMLHDVDRQPHTSSQYLPQASTYYPQYYNTGLPQFPSPYDQFAQNPHFRSGVQIYPYGPAIQVPVRPSKDQDPGKGVRSVLLEDFRTSGKSKRYELKVCLGQSHLNGLRLTSFRIFMTTLLSSAAINMVPGSYRRSFKRLTATRRNKYSGKLNLMRSN